MYFSKQVKTLFTGVIKLDMSNINMWEWFKFKIEHLAYDAKKAFDVDMWFWQNQNKWLSITFESFIQQILIISYPKKYYMVNMIIIIRKFHIHSCKLKNKRPSLA